MKIITSITKKVLFYTLLFCLISFNTYSQLEGSLTSKTIMYKKGETFQGTPTTQINNVVWKGDRNIQQLILWSSSSLQNISYEITDLTGPAGIIAKENLSLRYLQYALADLTVDGTCDAQRDWNVYEEMADILTNTPVTTIDATDPIKVILTTDIPTSTTAGTYSGNVNVKVGGVTQVTFDINLQVADYTLPDVSQWGFHLDIWQHPAQVIDQHNLANPGNQIAYWSPEHISLLTPLYTMLADMGQKVITAHIKDDALGGESMVKWIKVDQSTWEYDFSVFDAFVELLMSLGIDKQINCQSLVGWNSGVIPYYTTSGAKRNLNAAVGSSTYNTRWDHFLTAFKAHLESKGWFDKTYLYMDEIEEAAMTDVVNMIKANNENWKIGLSANAALSESLQNQIDDLSFIIQKSHQGDRTGKISTFYVCCWPARPNNLVAGDASPSENIWIGWHTMQRGMDGFLRWAYDFYDPSNTAWDDARIKKFVSGDCLLAYRSSNDINDMEFYESLRAVLIREGIQDYEKVQVLKQQFQNSNDPYENLALSLINAKIVEFNTSSGTTASVTNLVESAQTLLSDISVGNTLDPSVLPPENNYCAAGSTGAEYNVGSLTTTGGSTNINFATGSQPAEGYLYHHQTRLTIERGANFDVNFSNVVSWGGCSRVKVWIDWNIDGDFDDPGEEVYANGAAATCTNAIDHSFSLTVPAGNDGTTFMRVVFGDSWQAEPVACGQVIYSGAADFVIQIGASAPQNNPPTCSVTSPANGTNYGSPQTITISADASDTDGNVTGVDFFVNGVSIGTDASSPYSMDYSFAVGTYAITVKATDDQSATTTSSVVNITVGTPSNTPPTCSVTSPADGATYSSPQTITITADAADADGNVAGVEFFVDGVSIGTDATSPYSFDYSFLVGTYAITVKATDDQSAVTESAAINITVSDQSGQAPSIPSYCATGGDGQADYHVGSLTTTGGYTDISFTAGGFPSGGYEFHDATFLTVGTSGSFTVNFDNGSSFGGCSRVKMWIDWNGDGDFDDAGEEVYADGSKRKCNNATSHSVNVTIPAGVATGGIGMRIKFRDSYLNQPLACAVETHAGAADFVISVDPNKSTKLTTVNQIADNSLEVFPNPVNGTQLIKVRYNSEFASDATIGLYDILGKAIIQNSWNLLKGQNISEIPVNNLDKGVYIMKVKIGNTLSETRKIIIK